MVGSDRGCNFSRIDFLLCQDISIVDFHKEVDDGLNVLRVELRCVEHKVQLMSIPWLNSYRECTALVLQLWSIRADLSYYYLQSRRGIQELDLELAQL